jgi:hypothetical protein
MNHDTGHGIYGHDAQAGYDNEAEKLMDGIVTWLEG